MGVLHVKFQILTYFCDVISLLAQVYIGFIGKGIQRGVYKKLLNFWFLW